MEGDLPPNVVPAGFLAVSWTEGPWLHFPGSRRFKYTLTASQISEVLPSDLGLNRRGMIAYINNARFVTSEDLALGPGLITQELLCRKVY